MLQEYENPFIEYYKTAKEYLDTYDLAAGPIRVILNPQMRLIIETGVDQRSWENHSTTNEVAELIPDEYGQPKFRDIVLAKRVLDPYLTRLHQITHSYPAYMPLHYVLLFPYGQPR